MLYALNQKKFVEESLTIIHEKLADMGVVIRKPEQLKETVLTIGERYHQYKKQEQI